MKFEFVEYHRKATDEELLRDLERVAKKLGKDRLTAKEYNENGIFHCDTVKRRFGGWNKALEKISLHGGNRFVVIEDLYDNLENVWIKLGRQPVRRDMDNSSVSNISSSTYLQHFQTWNNALRSFVEYINSDEKPYGTEDVVNTCVEKTGHKTTRDVNLRLRFLVMKRDSFKCVMCGASPALNPETVLHIDHIVPWSKGGETIYDNLQTLCSKCNLGKGNIE